jgi:hypothetical protein
MSSRMSSNKKYCKVCHDSGKSEKEYTSHFTRENRNPNARIICPILKALECRYCCKSGHTVKYCPVLKNKETNKNYKKEKNTKENNTKVTNEKKEETNKFACLYDEESDDEKESAPVTPIISYATILKTEQKKVVETKMLDPVVLEAEADAEEVKPKSVLPTRRRILDWAAYCDSDSDDE